jgi:hypothetical protein
VGTTTARTPALIDNSGPGQGSTAKRTSYDPPPSRLKRILVIAIAATLAAGIGLTVVLWPQKDPAPEVLPTVAPETVPAPVPVPAPTPAPPPRPPAEATLVISTDAPAVISVDGVAQPLGQSATVQVKPGVVHVVTAQRPGHSVHTIHVPILGRGERLPVTIKLR